MTCDSEEPDDFQESGPFCRHYSEPGLCDVLCARCGHSCDAHGSDGDHPCSECGCDCEGWKEPD